MKIIAIEVVGDPAAQPRPRRSAQGGVYNPDTADEWKGAVEAAARAARPPGPPISVGCRVDIEFWMPRPQRLLKKGSPIGAIPHTGAPDRDNLDKAVLDALVRADILRDDALVYCGSITKAYHALGAKPGATILVSIPQAIDISGG